MSDICYTYTHLFVRVKHILFIILLLNVVEDVESSLLLLEKKRDIIVF